MRPAFLGGETRPLGFRYHFRCGVHTAEASSDIRLALTLRPEQPSLIHPRPTDVLSRRGRGGARSRRFRRLPILVRLDGRRRRRFASGSFRTRSLRSPGRGSPSQVRSSSSPSLSSALITVRFGCLSFSLVMKFDMPMHDSSRLFTYFCPLDAKRSVLLLFAVVEFPPLDQKPLCRRCSDCVSWQTYRFFRLFMCLSFVFFAIVQARCGNLMGFPRYTSLSAYLRPCYTWLCLHISGCLPSAFLLHLLCLLLPVTCIYMGWSC